MESGRQATRAGPGADTTTDGADGIQGAHAEARRRDPQIGWRSFAKCGACAPSISGLVWNPDRARHKPNRLGARAPAFRSRILTSSSLLFLADAASSPARAVKLTSPAAAPKGRPSAMYPISDLTAFCRKTTGDVPPKLVVSILLAICAPSPLTPAFTGRVHHRGRIQDVPLREHLITRVATAYSEPSRAST